MKQKRVYYVQHLANATFKVSAVPVGQAPDTPGFLQRKFTRISRKEYRVLANQLRSEQKTNSNG